QMRVEHVIAGVDETPDLRPIGEARERDHASMRAERMNVHEDEPDVLPLVEDATNGLQHELDVEVPQPTVSAEDDRVLGNAELIPKVVLEVGQRHHVRDDRRLLQSRNAEHVPARQAYLPPGSPGDP